MRNRSHQIGIGIERRAGKETAGGRKRTKRWKRWREQGERNGEYLVQCGHWRKSLTEARVRDPGSPRRTGSEEEPVTRDTAGGEGEPGLPRTKRIPPNRDERPRAAGPRRSAPPAVRASPPEGAPAAWSARGTRERASGGRRQATLGYWP